MACHIQSTEGQNLAPNPDFEDYSFCPTGLAATGFIPCTPWRSGTWGSVDYFNECSNPSQAGVPTNFFGWQNANSGVGYCGFYVKGFVGGDYREYLQGQLTSPLVAGKTYEISYYLNLCNRFCGIEHIGAYFSSAPPPYTNSLPLTVVPQFETDFGFINDTAEWVLITGCFVAEGGEEWVTIGNFRDNANTQLDTMCVTAFDISYYYIDDIYIGDIQPGGLDLELGDPVFDCDEYTIDPGIPGVSYYWEDGSTNPSLTVNTSGVYSLTIYDGCAAGVDSIDVTINAPPVEFDIDEYTMCTGETYTISLNPAYGEYTWQDGSNDTEYVISSSGVYQVTLDDGCDITSAEITVTVIDPPPPFSIGSDTILCTFTEYEIELDPDLGDFLWHDNSTSNAYNVSQEGYYAVTITNLCGAASASVNVTEVMPVDVNIGANEEILCPGDFVEIELDPDLGIYTWQDGTEGSEYLINSPGTYTVTLSHVCGESSDSVVALFFTPPVFDLGDTVVPCPGDTIILSVNGTEGDYTWQDGSENETFAVTTSGTYTLTIENACGSDQGDIVVMYEAALVPPDLGPDFSLCPGEEAVLASGNTGSGIVWQDMSTADTLLVISSGTYHVLVSNSCMSFADTVVVMLENTPPTITMPDQVTICQGNSTLLDPGLSGVTFNWSDGSSQPTLLVSTPGTYSLTVSSTCGSDMDTVQVLDGGPGPSVSLGTDVSVCTGEQVSLVPTFSNVDTWLWSDGSNNPTFATSAAGPVSVEVSNSCGVAYDTMLISLLPLTPSFSLGPDTSLCADQMLTLTIAEPNVDIVWSDGSTGNSLVAAAADMQVYATITNGCGASADTVDIAALPAIPALDLGDDQSLCPGELIVFDPGIADVDYLWHDGSVNPTYETTQEETVVLVITNACGMTTDTAEVIESTDGPQVDLGADVRACEGESITIPAGISGVSYLWQDGSGSDEYVATSSGWVHLTVTNLCGMDTDSIWVDISGVAPIAALGNDTILCEGITMVLTSEADAQTTIQWQDGSSGQTYLVTTSGTYTLMETNQCGQSFDSIEVSYLNRPQPFTLGVDTTLCPGASVTLTAPSTSNEIRWQDGSNQPSIVVDQAGTYTLQISNDCGVETDAVQVDVDTRIPALNLDSTMEWCEGDVIELDATQPFIAGYLWSTGETTPSIQILSPGQYSVEVSTLCNMVSGQVDIVPGTDCEIPDVNTDIYIPNVFSPNGDGSNDAFSVSFGSDIQVTAMEGSIYDRWGNLVFLSTTHPFMWDGTFADKPMMPGVYVYSIRITYMALDNERVEVFVGDLTVVR